MKGLYQRGKCNSRLGCAQYSTTQHIQYFPYLSSHHCAAAAAACLSTHLALSHSSRERGPAYPPAPSTPTTHHLDALLSVCVLLVCLLSSLTLYIHHPSSYHVVFARALKKTVLCAFAPRRLVSSAGAFGFLLARLTW
jgi:hypothetical protein